MTKTCLDVLKQLGHAFSSAMEASGKGPTRKVAPYVLKNETGLGMILNLEHSLFKVRKWDRACKFSICLLVQVFVDN